jgi:curved DNA-binding protein CbpA
MEPIDRYLDVLSLKRGASKADLKSAYRALIQISHPDRFHDNETLRKKAEEQTKLLNEAYKYLSSHIDRVSRAERPDGAGLSDRMAAAGGAGPVDDPIGRARREEEKKRQDAEYRKRKALREAREARQRDWDRERERYDRRTALLGVLFVILLILYASYARRGGEVQGMAGFRAEAVGVDPELGSGDSPDAFPPVTRKQSLSRPGPP